MKQPVTRKVRTERMISEKTSDGKIVLKPTYENILNFMMENPAFTHAQIAAHFGVGRQWITLVVGTDAFKTRMKEKQDQIFLTATATVRDKLHGLAHQAIDKLSEAMESMQNPEEIRASMESILDRIGYHPAKPGSTAPSGVQNQQNNFYVASPDDLARARTIMHKAQEEKLLPAEVERAEPAPQISRDES